MPMRRRYTRKRKRRYYYGRKRKRITLRKTAKQVYRLKNAIETKAHDVSSGVQSCTFVAQSTQLNSILEGTSGDEVVGRSFFMKTLHLKYRLAMSSTTEPNLAAVRVMVVLIKDPVFNSATPAFTTLFNVVSGGSPIPSYHASKKMDRRFGFRVLYDRKHDMGSINDLGTSTWSGGGKISQTVSTYIPIKFKAVYDDTTSNLNRGQLILFWMSAVDEGVNTPPCSILACPRLYYTDA